VSGASSSKNSQQPKKRNSDLSAATLGTPWRGSAAFTPLLQFFLIALVCLVICAGPATCVFTGHARVDSLNNLGRGYLFSNIEQSVTQYGQAAEEARPISIV